MTPRKLTLLLLCAVSPALALTDTVTVTNMTAGSQVNRPVSFPRYFLQGEIPRCAQAVYGGVPPSIASTIVRAAMVPGGVGLLTQCDVKTRWPDGSVQFAVISFVIPSLASRGTYTVSFQDQPCSTDGFLTRSQILDPGAIWSTSLGAQIATANGATTQSADLLTMLTAWDGSDGGANGLDVRYWLKGPVVSQIIVENKSTRAYDFGWSFTSLTTSQSLAIVAVGTSQALNVSSTASVTVGDVIKLQDEQLHVTAINSSTQLVVTRGYNVSGSCDQIWGGPLGCPAAHASGTIGYLMSSATTDSTNKPLHPVFVVTLFNGWPVVKIQAILENDWTTALKAQVFDFSLKVGNPLGSAQWVHPALTQFARTRIQRTFWSGATFGNYGLPDDLKIDLNLPYMAFSAIVPNYDLTKQPTRTDVLNKDSNVWAAFSAAQKDINGDDALNNSATGMIGPRAGSFPKGMPQGGQTQMDWIGILPAWVARYLYTMSDPTVLPSDTFPMLFGNADASGYVPMHLRESRVGATTYCAHSCSGADLTFQAYGQPVSIDARPSLWQHDQTLGFYGVGADIITPLETLDINDWLVDLAHQPAHVFSAYLITGDWYWLEEMQFWMSHDLIAYGGGSSNITSRGNPSWWGVFNTGSERMDAWSMRTLGQLSQVLPDAQSPQKTFFKSKLNNNIAFNEGKYGITDGLYNGSAIWNWANNTPCTDSYSGGHASEHIGCGRDSQSNPLYLTEPTMTITGTGRKYIDEAGGFNTGMSVNAIVTSITDNGSGFCRITHTAVDSSRYHPTTSGADGKGFHVFMIYVTDKDGVPLEGRFTQTATSAPATSIDIDAPYNGPYTLTGLSRLMWRYSDPAKDGADIWYSASGNAPYMFFFKWAVMGYLRDMGYGFDAILRKSTRSLIHSFSNNALGDGFTNDLMGGEWLSPEWGSNFPTTKPVKIGGVWYMDAMQTYAEIVQGIGNIAKLKSDYDASCNIGGESYCHLHHAALSFAYPYDDNLGTTGTTAWANSLTSVPHQNVVSSNPKWAFVPRTGPQRPVMGLQLLNGVHTSGTVTLH